jgi:hypothetical protein
VIQLHCDARALSVEILRRGQPDPAVAAGDKDILVRYSAHCPQSFRLNVSLSAALRGNLAAAAYQLGETRFAESLLNSVVRGVEDWAKPAIHRATPGGLDADLARSLALLSAGNALSSSLNSKTSRSRLRTRSRT